jgi:hypothetical protein
MREGDSWERKIREGREDERRDCAVQTKPNNPLDRLIIA